MTAPYYEQENSAVAVILGYNRGNEIERRSGVGTPSAMTQEGLVPMFPKDTPSALCACGCGTVIKSGRRWVSGHNLLKLERTDTHRDNISSALKKAWSTKRKRMDIGATYVGHDGYVLVKTVEGSGPWVPQHILVFEQATGIAVKPGEVIHHINGVRDDNTPENLHLFKNKSEHNKAHRSFARLLKSLIEDGTVRFNPETGRYER